MNIEELTLASEKLLDAIDISFEDMHDKNKLFISNDLSYNTNVTISDDENARIIGYLDAAKLLSHILITTLNGKNLNTLIYPIIYLYRHYIELSLKSFIKRGAFITNIEIDDKLKIILNSHNLCKLYNKFSLIFKNIFTEEEHEFEEAKRLFRLFIQQIHKIDPNSTKFRYITSTHKKYNDFQENDIEFCVLNFCSNIEKMTECFEGIDFKIDCIVEYNY